MIAAGYDDGTVQLLDVDTGESVRQPLEGNTVAVRAMSTLAVSVELNLLAVAGGDRVVKVWNFAGGEAHPFKVVTTGLGSVSALALVSNGDGTVCLVIGGKNGAIEFWDLLHRRRIGHEPTAHKRHVASLTAVQLPRGDLLVASGGHDQTIRFWDPVTGTRGNLPPIDNRAPFSAMLQVPDHLGDPLVAVASQEDRVKIRVWNTVTGEMEGRSMSPPPIKATGAPSGGGGRVTAMTMMRTDIGHDLLVTGNTNHTIRLWDLATRTLLHRIDFGEEITACQASGERLIVGSTSGVTLLELNQTPN
ncbi:WD40 repeat domain-containing protein [Amycolatopsis sp. A133]|uniref:WD40 repeat domain-containing protein n=1 Tax=Amycolatopsis sp. A133 TaxID=3064472 RepID=UPI0027FC81D7|nr:WD40 repeat domain-containing protein [Amycolatopsis sp. A133]MDQ7810566.1 WD40 repeat domain-containing protein [Amycolatopsis sp. A133]